ncbi:PepSY-associated TM helix domain-containing protein [Caulobacter mirabilis]|uniref:Peptidase n=1 Tax=Caulobacter mirabilis TaxID=69666 RepID=A0A2D2AV67_9CAUL|nr:PepSY-associated TM helix domain-containing protein [Caulobacter mirabilis]ATQ41888.1 peptidase [Caulobacter mirabilis]
MNGAFRQSMAWLHTWTGLLVGWVLFAMFTTGTATYFRPEITRWMEPETGMPASPSVAAAGALAFLQAKAPDAKSWSITLPDERSSTVNVFWEPQPKAGEEDKPRRRRRGSDTSAVLDAATGEVVKPRETRGGEFFYRFHFQMHYMPVIAGRWVAGFCAMFMLAAIVSGVITHKRIFKDFFTFRPGKAAQRSWLDAHNLTAVLALPFHAMITYTGLVTLMALYMPWGALANYKTEDAFFEQLFPQTEAVERSGVAVGPPPLTLVLDEAARTWGGGRSWIVGVSNPGDATSTIEVTRHTGDQLSNRSGSLTFDARGKLVSSSAKAGPAAVTSGAMYGLHMGRFAKPLLRWLYFVCALTGCAMVATGLILWTVKRRQQLPDPEKPYFGFRLVERLNIGTIAGVPAGMAMMLWANRLLPVEMATRSPWEVHAVFVGWGGMILYACLRPTKKAWVETLSAAAALVALLPVVSAITTPNRNLLANLLRGDWAMVAFDLTLVTLGAGLAFCAWKAARYKPAVKAKRKPPAPAPAAAVTEEAA